jgi:hypothetical protein
MTEWRDIPGFEGLYTISEYGEIRGVRRVGSSGRSLRPGLSTAGYLQVVLYPGDGTRVQRPIHRLVLEAFVGPAPEGAMALHADDDKVNNHVSNLRWGSRSENALDAVRNGRHACAIKTHCKHGHAFEGYNLIIRPDGTRACRACKYAEIARRKAVSR